jgi:predicted DsbA family dithiol-disulfide isomerase
MTKNQNRETIFSIPCSFNSYENQAPGNLNQNKMQVEIWSDIVCPFCYIGKRKFEQALEKFPQKDKVEIVWKSFQLDPDASSRGTDYQKNLSARKGWSLEQTQQITKNVTDMAAEVGLEYHFEKAVAANSFDAHRFFAFGAQKWSSGCSRGGFVQRSFY